MCSARSSFRRKFSFSCCRRFISFCSTLRFAFGPRFWESALRAPARYSFLHSVRCDEKSPSRRSRPPISPDSRHRSAS